jgi:hypothetical protein
MDMNPMGQASSVASTVPKRSMTSGEVMPGMAADSP